MPFSSSKRCPLQMVVTTRHRNCSPSIGLHWHLLCMQSWFTVQASPRLTMAKSALYPGLINPRLLTANNRAGAWHISSTTLQSLARLFRIVRALQAARIAPSACPKQLCPPHPFYQKADCGAWSVPTTVMCPSVNAARKASRSARVSLQDYI